MANLSGIKLKALGMTALILIVLGGLLVFIFIPRQWMPTETLMGISETYFYLGMSLAFIGSLLMYAYVKMGGK